jgi:exopolysaccharide biosynthesis protein
MNYKGKKVIVGVLLLALTLLPFAGTAYAIPKSSIIHESTTSQIVTSGVTYENITRFTTEGWLNINALRIDLSNEHIQVDTLVNTQYLSELASTKSLAESRGAVAAVNASFFTPTGNGSGYPDGPIVESGKIISSTGEYNLYGNYMASFSLDGFGKALYNYWKSEIKLQPAECQPIIINQYNKPSKVKYTDFTILDRRWSDTSIGANETYPDIVEMVVIEGEVVEIRQSQPPIQIPQNGYVVVTRQSGGERLLDCFEIGDSIDMSVTTTPEWNSFKMSVTGSSMLVMDGEIPDKFSFDLPYISKRQPRTVVGTSQDGSQLILVTVDGRQNNSIGLTQLETARLMLDLGAYNALNLDGGGSTTMVGRSLGSHGLDVSIALAVKSDGIHVGQEDMPIEEVRKIAPNMIIGLSTHNKEQAKYAVEKGADYIGVGPIFNTTTKKNIEESEGLEYLKWVKENIKLPYVAIGGIKEENIDIVKEYGGYCFAMISELTGAENIVDKVKSIREKLK